MHTYIRKFKPYDPYYKRMNREDVSPDRDNMRERTRRMEEVKRREKEENDVRKNETKTKLKKSLSRRSAKSFWARYQDHIGYAALGAVVVFVLYLNFSGDKRRLDDIIVNEDTHIQAHNESSKDYSVKMQSFFQGMSMAQARDIFKNNLTNKKSQPKCNTTNLQDVKIPESYNFYKQHPNCKHEQVQPKNSASYALAHASVYRSRFCLFSMGDDFTPSLDYLLNCDTKDNKGGKSGFLLNSLDFVNDNGHISEKCWNSLNVEEGKCPTKSQLDKCQRYKLNNYCVLEGVDDIKREIFKNGPVVSMIQPFRNFLVYEKGLFTIHEHENKLDGFQAVKIVGWDHDSEGNEWWIVENFWGHSWGEEGTARVLIGSEDSFLDKFAVALYPAAFEKDSAKSS